MIFVFRSYKSIPLLSRFVFYIVSYTCQFQRWVIILTRTDRVFSQFNSIITTYCILLYFKLIAAYLRIHRNPFKGLIRNWSFPNSIGNFLLPKPFIFDSTIIIRPVCYSSIWFVGNFCQYIPFLSISLIQKIILNALCGKSNSKWFTLSYGCVDNFYSCLWTSYRVQ